MYREKKTVRKSGTMLNERDGRVYREKNVRKKQYEAG